MADQITSIEKSIPAAGLWSGYKYVTTRSELRKNDEFVNERNRIGGVMDQVSSKGASFYQWVNPDVKAKFEWAKWWFWLASLISAVHGWIVRILFKSGLYEQSAARADRFWDDIGFSGIKAKYLGGLGPLGIVGGIGASVSRMISGPRPEMKGFTTHEMIAEGSVAWYPFLSADRLWVSLRAGELSERALVVTERYKPGKKGRQEQPRSYVIINVPEKGPEGTKLFTAVIDARYPDPGHWRFHRSGWLWPNHKKFNSFRMMSAKSAGLSDVLDAENQLIIHGLFNGEKTPRRLRRVESVRFSLLSKELTDGLQKAFLNGERAAEKFAENLPESDLSALYPSAGFGIQSDEFNDVFDEIKDIMQAVDLEIDQAKTSPKK